MKNNIFLIILLNCFIMAKCQDHDELLGKWIDYYNTDHYWTMGPDSIKFGMKETFEITGTWELKQNNILDVQTIDKVPFEYYYALSNNFLVIFSEKDGPNEIDEIHLFTKKESDAHQSCENKPIKVIFNKDNPGFYMINFLNFERPYTKDSIMEYREVIVDTNFTESSSRINAIDYAFKNFNFSFQSKELKVFMDDEIIDKNEKTYLIDSTELIVYIYGFNQIPRNTVNKMVNKKIDGDILMLYFGPYKDLELKPPYPVYDY